VADNGSVNYVQLAGPRVPAAFMPLEEIVRPFSAGQRGITLPDEEPRLELPYSDLAQRTASAAARLRGGGVTPGTLVAMTVTNDLPSILAVLATWACGATVVSLPPVPRNDHGWHARQFRPVLERMGCDLFIGDEDLDEDAAIRRIPKQPLAQAEPRPVPLPDQPVPATALIQFTSGSVGTPKGVAIGAAALAGHVAAISAAAYYDGEAGRIVSWLPLYHDMGLIAMFLTGLAARMDLVIARPAGFATRPSSWLRMLSQERATATAAPNFAYRLAAAVPYNEPLDLSRMRVSICGGERPDWQSLMDFTATTAPMGFSAGALIPCYGLAESIVAVTYTRPGRGPLRGPAGYVSAGVPLPGVEVRAPAGSVPRPIQLRGEWLFSGYHTADGFAPADAADGWFDTGDAGFIHDGELYVLGRRNEVLSLAGRNVFAEDVESITHEACGQLVRACAAFRNLGTVGRFGLVAEANTRLVRNLDAAQELARHIQVSVNEALGTRLTPVLVARLGAIPRTTSGKVQRARCRSMYDSGQISRRLITELA
jgi:fatty-acyl-CoA synthase